MVGCKEPRRTSAPADVAVEGSAPVVRPPAVDVRRAEPVERWRMAGTLLGVADGVAVVANPAIVAVDVSSGTVLATADTTGEDPAPNLERYLPRLGDEDAKVVEVDRLADAPVYFGDSRVVYLRGRDDMVTSIVGLVASTLEPAWALPLAYREPVRTCATSLGVLLVPRAGEPARFVGWDGAQRWLRELGERDETVESFACRETTVEALLGSKSSRRVRSFDAATGELLDSRSVGRDAQLEPWEPPPDEERLIRQEAAEVVGYQ